MISGGCGEEPKPDGLRPRSCLIKGTAKCWATAKSQRVTMGTHSSREGRLSEANVVVIPNEGLHRPFVEGRSPIMQPVEAVIRELAQSEVPVLLLAERGAGKQTTARRIHDLSRRSSEQ